MVHMEAVEIAQSIDVVRHCAINDLHKAFGRAEAEYCSTMMRLIGESIKIRAPFLTVFVKKYERGDPIILTAQGLGVKMSMSLYFADATEESGIAKNVSARFVTIRDLNRPDNSLLSYQLPLIQDGSACWGLPAIFEIVPLKVCDTIEKIIGVDIRSDLREAVRQPMRRNGADRHSLAGGPTG